MVCGASHKIILMKLPRTDKSKDGLGIWCGISCCGGVSNGGEERLGIAKVREENSPRWWRSRSVTLGEEVQGGTERSATIETSWPWGSPSTTHIPQWRQTFGFLSVGVPHY